MQILKILYVNYIVRLIIWYIAANLFLVARLYGIVSNEIYIS